MGAVVHPGLLLAVLTRILLGSAPAQAEALKTPGARFTLEPKDVVVFVGGANMVSAQQSSHLETLLTMGFPQSNARFRDIAWEGDTVFKQQREMNFGSWPEQLARVGETVLFAQFGQMESLQGPASLPEFIQAYQKLLDQVNQQTRQVVLLSPPPFEKPKPPLPDLSLRNDDLRLYVEAIRELARTHGYSFVDLFTPFRDAAGHGLHLTDDGLQLTPGGDWAIARETASQLGLGDIMLGFPLTGSSIIKFQPVQASPATGVLRPDSAERLRALIQAKNRLWFDFWRPMNWAFLHGDRTEQPSSRDHRDPKIRWFPDEINKFLPLIEAKEKAIAKLAAEAAQSKSSTEEPK